MMDGAIRISDAEVKLTYDEGELKVLTLQASAFTDQIQPGTPVLYQRQHYRVVGKWKPQELTPPLICLSLRLREEIPATKGRQ